MPVLHISAVILSLLSVFLLGGCLEKHTPSTEAIVSSAPSLPRAHPGYIQWLRKQSLLEQAQEYTNMLAETPLQWGLPHQTNHADLLLREASLWLHISPKNIHTSGKIFTHLASSTNLNTLRATGIEGILIAPTAENGTLWHDYETDGYDAVNFAFSHECGTDNDLTKLTEQAEATGIRTGGNILPVATGVGPDFFLAARHTHGFSGLYMMIEIPHNLWQFLPNAQTFFPFFPTDALLLERLRTAALLPPTPTTQQHINSKISPLMGWATTGPIMGTDGQERRWLYRWHGNILRPVLHWANPTGRAAQLFSAALIRHTGLLRQTLTCFDASPLFASTNALSVEHFAISDTAAFCNTIARENHKYGGWSLLNTEVPSHLLKAVQATGVDFVRDSTTVSAALNAMLTGVSIPLSQALQGQLRSGIIQSRLARIMPNSSGISLSPAMHSAWLAHLPNIDLWQLPIHDGKMYATSTTLAALSANLSPTEASKPTHVPRILRKHLLLTAFCAGLPGLFIPHDEDLRGFLTTPTQKTTAHFSCYPELSLQQKDPNSYASHLLQLSKLRQRLGIAQGVLVDVPTSPTGCVAAIFRLPKGEYFLLAANFSSIKQQFSLPLTASRATLEYGYADISHNKNNFSLTLKADECVFVLLENVKSASIQLSR